MKKIIVAIVLLTFSFAYPLKSFAFVEEANISNFGKLSIPEACFVSVTIVSVLQNQFNGSETLFFNNSPVATLAVLLGLSVILSNGSSILFGSPSFAAEAGADPDVMLSDQDCANLQEGDEISFSGSGGSVIAAITIVGLFVTSVAFLLNTLGSFDRVNLADFTVILTALLVTQIIIGNGPLFNPNPSSDGGGCSLQAQAHRPNHGWVFLLGFLGLGAWGLCRRWRLG